MLLLLSLLSLASVVVGAARPGSYDAVPAPVANSIQAREDVINAYPSNVSDAQGSLLFALFPKKNYKGNGFAFLTDAELDFHGEDTALCYYFNKEATSLLIKPRHDKKYFGCYIYDMPGWCKGESHFVDRSIPDLSTVGWEKRITAAKCWMKPSSKRAASRGTATPSSALALRDPRSLIAREEALVRYYNMDRFQGDWWYMITETEMSFHPAESTAICNPVVYGQMISVRLTPRSDHRYYGCKIYKDGNCGPGDTLWLDRNIYHGLEGLHWAGEARSIKCWMP